MALHVPRVLGRWSRPVALAAVGAAAVVGLVASPAGAYEYGNPDFGGVLASTSPMGYPVSPAALQLNYGWAGANISVKVTNLTGTTQSQQISFEVDHILTYQGQDISDGQPGQPGIMFPVGAASQMTQTPYTPVATQTLTVQPWGSTTLWFPVKFANCGYYQVDFFHHFPTGTKYLASGFTRVLGCGCGHHGW